MLRLLSALPARAIDPNPRIVLVEGIEDLVEQVDALAFRQVRELVRKKRKQRGE